ncbi:protein MANBAL [Polyodon spathula]|uniref:protein MANBAL n=1 Tax=Polyodon spathula TaxID=7913 RepID=UPI001B7E279B|nr:protein MANBAL [Polyodon spathula]
MISSGCINASSNTESENRCLWEGWSSVSGVQQHCQPQAADRQVFSTEHGAGSRMAGVLDLSAPEIPEPTFLESVLRYGLFLGALFQIICILAVIIPSSKLQESDAEPFERSVDQTKKPKGPVPLPRQKSKKESKKKR